VRKRTLRNLEILVLVIVCMALPSSARAQQGGITTYVHDDNGRLHAVISPTGEAVVYEYDAAGNITAIRRLQAGAMAILGFSPHEGLPGDPVKFFGVGFGTGVTDVVFNGSSAALVSASVSMVVATVPQAATTGLVTITTPRGSLTTTLPFTIAGLRISPSVAAIKFGDSLTFTAEVLPSTTDQSVEWSVNDRIGGSAKLGTISPAGVYIAPYARQSSTTIRATSITDASRFGEAHVRVNDPNDIQTVFGLSVSIQKRDSIGATARAAAVTVRYDDVTDLQTALSPPVSVQYESGSRPYTALAAVSSTTGPYIRNITPDSLNRGITGNLTITGVGLSGASTLRFIKANGSLDTDIAVANLSVTSDGSLLTAVVIVSPSAAPGNRIVVVATPNSDSVAMDLGINTLNVQ
jgi:YD repeat-containing protein